MNGSTGTPSGGNHGHRVSRASSQMLLIAIGALIIGFGVPLAWVWIGSRIQGTTGTSAINSSTAAVMLLGILITYVGILFFAGWVQGRVGGPAEDDGAEPQPPVRYPWNRSMRDEPYRPGARRLTPIEALFVTTALVASGAFLVWFFGFAGSSLPSA